MAATLAKVGLGKTPEPARRRMVPPPIGALKPCQGEAVPLVCDGKNWYVASDYGFSLDYVVVKEVCPGIFDVTYHCSTTPSQ